MVDSLRRFRDLVDCMGELDVLLNIHRRYERTDNTATDTMNRCDHTTDATAIKLLVNQPDIVLPRLKNMPRIGGKRRTNGGREIDLIVKRRTQSRLRIRHTGNNLLTNNVIQIRRDGNERIQNILICLDRIGVNHRNTTPLPTHSKETTATMLCFEHSRKENMKKNSAIFHYIVKVSIKYKRFRKISDRIRLWDVFLLPSGRNNALRAI